jgi:thiamine pyrophosphokinase
VGKRVLGVLAGGDMPSELLRAWADSAEVVLAADAGADRLLEAGARPTKIVGDLDSISEYAKDMGVEVVHLADQETTDCDKLLSMAAGLGYDHVTLASVEGDSLDHLLATVFSALRARVSVRFALRRGIAWLLRTDAAHDVAKLVIHPGLDRRVSLIPLAPCKGVRLEGVCWPLHNAELSPTGLVSISNRSTGSWVQASLEEGAALLVAEFPVEEMPLW